MLGKALRV
jgi:predicted MFS family arabinose efflux permease